MGYNLLFPRLVHGRRIDGNSDRAAYTRRPHSPQTIKRKGIEMGQYNIDYACGHSGTVRLFDKINDRMKTLEWLQTKKMP